ncbi:MAG TPA: response regulator [Ideonella sp.]|uniref:response regulator transcription factor n=1 Tax=Ideonella sp. TaxID=1929293 RepID=UPI002E311176|nr:response regulator [Ideonella sp.]HEX5684420.1 response regulator [Ideonella sp.]
MSNAPPQLLLVDDEDVFLLLTRTLLERAGFAVTPVSESPLAVELVEQGFRPDVILLDFRMPVLTGPEVLKKLRAAGSSAPAVLVSAIRDVEREGALHGFDSAVAKPFSSKGLVDVVNGLLRRRSGSFPP